MLVKAIDVASYQPRDLSAIIAQYEAQHVIVHLYHDQESVPWAHSAAQIQSTLDSGCTPGGYAFPYPHQDMVRIVNNVMDRCASIGLVLPLLWWDVETYEPTGENITPQDLHTLVDQCGLLGAPCGIYTSAEMWRRLGNPSGFGHLPLLNAYYDGDPDFDFWLHPYGEWTDVAGEQYRGDPLDLDILKPEYTRLAAPIPVDPCDDERRKLAAVQAIIDHRPYCAPSKKALTAALST